MLSWRSCNVHVSLKFRRWIYLAHDHDLSSRRIFHVITKAFYRVVSIQNYKNCADFDWTPRTSAYKAATERTSFVRERLLKETVLPKFWARITWTGWCHPSSLD